MNNEEKLNRVLTLARAVRKCYTEEIQMSMIQCFLVSIEQILSCDNDYLSEIKVNLDNDDRLAKEILAKQGIK